eukprot:TRINITY_DN11656_c0_g1_i2.p1 TRINITY_DN11656_c0_g1~~TRINITY_DN11656_c0_g1_i2.p1  ORF type:complete len:187 (-),score=28.08 TRINITY_DN11656_c0_g1_i2:28-588(-)
MVFAGGFSKDKDLCAFGSTRRQTTVVLVVFFLMSIFAMYQCRQQFYGAVNSYVLWSESLGGLGLFFVAFGMFITQLLPIPFLFIGLCVTATFSLGFGQAFTPLCVGTLAGLVFTWCICHSSLRYLPFTLHASMFNVNPSFTSLSPKTKGKIIMNIGHCRVFFYVAIFPFTVFILFLLSFSYNPFCL